MRSQKNKKNFLPISLFVIFFSVLLFGFFGDAFIVSAQTAQETPTAAVAAGIESSLETGEPNSNIFIEGLKWVLYTLIWFFSGLTNVAASVFAWATKPEYISGPTGLLNLKVVYSLWKFIRDFFNLAFIFLLLFSAFGTIFQLHQFNLKKNFFQIIFAAILINFSFPITRLVIDFGNVPMYFFRNAIAGSGEGNSVVDIPLAFFRNSALSDILFPAEGKSASVFSLITGVVFSFMFMITLFALSILFIFRLIKLVILLIFSPFGVAASIVPGIEKYGKQWWSELFQTVFFGPAAMLMLVVALRFLTEINGTSLAQGGEGGTSAGGSQALVAQGIFFIPIILMWMAMQVGHKFGIEGSSMVMKYADKAVDKGKSLAKGAAAYPWNNSAMKGVRKGVNKRAYEGRLFGDKIKKFTGGYLGAKAWKEGGQNTEARIAGFIDKGKKGAALENRKIEDKRIQEKMKQFKDEYLSRTDLENKLLTGSETEKKAAALSLAESKEGIKKKPEILSAALELFRNDYDKYEKVLKSSDDDAVGMDPTQFAAAHLAGVEAILSQQEGLNKELIKNLSKSLEPLNKKVETSIQAGISKGLTYDDSKNEAIESLSDDERRVFKASEKAIIDFGKQIKKTGGDIDKLFEYQQNGQSLSSMNQATIIQMYEQHKLTMKDLSQQSALLRNDNFQKYAQQNFTPTAATELAKLVVQNNKNSDVKVIVENIASKVRSRGSSSP